MQKTLFLRSNIKILSTNKTTQTLSQKHRKCTFEYSFNDSNGIKQIVCRRFFTQCLQVSKYRIGSALKTLNENPGAQDRRGTSAPINKTDERELSEVRNFKTSIPSYESHYGRSSTQKKFLKPGLNIIKLYREYESAMTFQQKKIVSEYIFRRVFNTEYNKSFKRRHSDSCQTCDRINCQAKSRSISNEDLRQIEIEKDAHIMLVEKTRTILHNDILMGKADMKKTIVLTFDLQKTLETPSLSTNVAYYKRQLWTYNLCIYDEIDSKGCYFFNPKKSYLDM